LKRTDARNGRAVVWDTNSPMTDERTCSTPMQSRRIVGKKSDRTDASWYEPLLRRSNSDMIRSITCTDRYGAFWAAADESDAEDAEFRMLLPPPLVRLVMVEESDDDANDIGRPLESTDEGR